MVAAAFDKDGKVAGTIIDNAQTKVNFDKNGKVASDKNAEIKTKVELGDEYGMKKASRITSYNVCYTKLLRSLMNER